MGRRGPWVQTTAPPASVRSDFINLVCRYRFYSSPYFPPFLYWSADLWYSHRQVRCVVQFLSVLSLLVCIRWLIQEPAVLIVEVNKLMEALITGGIVCQWLTFPSQVVFMRERSIQRAAAGLQTQLHVWHVCAWMVWPPALKYTVCLHVLTSSVCLGSAAQCVLVSIFALHFLSFCFSAVSPSSETHT